jgi:hypothetical protein
MVLVGRVMVGWVGVVLAMDPVALVVPRIAVLNAARHG